jgi:amino acid transporter
LAWSPQLHRALDTFDLVLLNVAAIVGLRYLSIAAQIGPSSLTLWLLGLITFLIPAALTVLELSSRLPGEGAYWNDADFSKRCSTSCAPPGRPAASLHLELGSS